MQESYKKVALGYKTPCWIWQGGLTQDGYGYFGGEATHRLYYRRKYGPIPEGKEIHHRCKIKSCVNPDHLQAVTHQKHMRLHGKKVKSMGRSSSNTVVTSFRISRNQQQALKDLPPSISASVIVRTLLEEYLSGNLPEVHSLIIAEAGRTQDAVVNSQF